MTKKIITMNFKKNKFIYLDIKLCPDCSITEVKINDSSKKNR